MLFKPVMTAVGVATVTLTLAFDQVAPLSDECSTSYPVIAEPLFVGAVQVAVNWLLPDESVRPAGASGAPALVDAADGDQKLSPWVFAARTCTRYAVLLVRLVMVYDRAVFAAASISSVVQVEPPFEE